jgi:hypothetical protein
VGQPVARSCRGRGWESGLAATASLSKDLCLNFIKELKEEVFLALWGVLQEPLNGQREVHTAGLRPNGERHGLHAPAEGGKNQTRRRGQPHARSRPGALQELTWQPLANTSAWRS